MTMLSRPKKNTGMIKAKGPVNRERVREKARKTWVKVDG
jgi:hypothetical protein